ncbi:response regulator transcription factor [Oceanospirillum maris]|jgi:DNA-binding response OmpR family regulator|uniref:response regulator transcription factor n=1 Tax=Oceanospirillum maris TaxID=64977 RepID=UPI0003FB94C1|nr:response regulator transcription factor [Oceanospirillum maris]
MMTPKALAKPVSVVLVEDDQSLRDSLVEYLELKGLCVQAVGTAEGFYCLMKRNQFQVAVIDLGLPDASGEELVDFSRQNSDMSLIVITANDGLSSRVSCYRSGADLFMAKPVYGQELAAAIFSLADRQQDRAVVDDSAPTDGGRWLLNGKSWLLITPLQTNVECTVKEYRLLALLAETPSEPVKRPKLLQALYGRDDDSAQRALDTVVRRLRQKIQQATGEDSSPIRTVYSVGYLFADQIELSMD